MTYEIMPAVPEDAEEMLNVQRLAYRGQAELYNNFDIPPLKETLGEIAGQFSTHISYAGRILGEFGPERIEVRRVDYEFQINGNKLLIIKGRGAQSDIGELQ